jgi:diaminopimelate decarboxylase
MSIQSLSNVRTQIAGVSVLEIARQFGTPTYVYDAKRIVEQIEKLRAFDVIRFAQKANSNIAVLDLMRQNGVVVDAVSAGEVLRAQAAGYDLSEPHQVVFTADIFDQQALQVVKDHKLHVNVGSPDMISQLGEISPGAEITLRVNPGFGHGHSQKTNTGGEQSKHGIWFEEVEACVALATKNQLTVTGLHMHIGSGTDFEHLSQVCEAMVATARIVGDSLTTISTGGGLPTPYRPDDTTIDLDRYFVVWDAARKTLESEFGHSVTLEIEPGRFLVAESGYLVCEVRAIKEMGNNRFCLVDAGFNNLARPVLYGAYHPMSIAFADGREQADQMDDLIIGGPLCESGDIFTQSEGGYVNSCELPSCSVGDLLIIECAGAYGFVMSSNYNSKPMIAEVLIKDGNAIEVRKRQTLESLFADETIPE